MNRLSVGALNNNSNAVNKEMKNYGNFMQFIETKLNDENKHANSNY